MKTSESIVNIIKARIAAKNGMRKPHKDSINPHFKSRYTSYEELIACIEEALAPNGLDMVVELLEKEGKVGCRITLFHTSGEFLQTEDFFLPANQTSQGYGSAATYVLRYCISAFWSIAAEDDDGNESASINKQPARTVDSSVKYEVKDSKPEETSLKRKQAQKVTMAKFTEKGISDEIRYEMIKKEFNKDSIKTLTLDELRKLYRIVSTYAIAASQ